MYFGSPDNQIKYEFSGSWNLDTWVAPRLAAVYIIMVYDRTCTPQPYRAIYVGETQDLSTRGFPNSHHASTRWRAEASRIGSPLYVAYHAPAEAIHDGYRTRVESYLETTYNPICSGSLLQALLPIIGRH